MAVSRTSLLRYFGQRCHDARGSTGASCRPVVPLGREAFRGWGAAVVWALPATARSPAGGTWRWSVVGGRGAASGHLPLRVVLSNRACLLEEVGLDRASLGEPAVGGEAAPHRYALWCEDVGSPLLVARAVGDADFCRGSGGPAPHRVTPTHGMGRVDNVLQAKFPCVPRIVCGA